MMLRIIERFEHKTHYSVENCDFVAEFFHNVFFAQEGIATEIQIQASWGDIFYDFFLRATFQQKTRKNFLSGCCVRITNSS